MKQLEHVFVENQRKLFAAALAITRCRVSAEDAVHEALIAVATLNKAPDDMAAYLFRVVRNKALHGIRKDRKQVELADDFLDEAHGNNEQETLIQQIKEHIKVLGTDEQQVLILKLFEGLTFNEIARIMETPQNTVASWYRRGLEKLKERIGDEDE